MKTVFIGRLFDIGLLSKKSNKALDPEGFTGREKFDRIWPKQSTKGGQIVDTQISEQSIHLNVSERFQVDSILQNLIVNLSFVTGPAIFYLIAGWIIGIPFLR